MDPNFVLVALKESEIITKLLSSINKNCMDNTDFMTVLSITNVDGRNNRTLAIYFYYSLYCRCHGIGEYNINLISLIHNDEIIIDSSNNDKIEELELDYDNLWSYATNFTCAYGVDNTIEYGQDLSDITDFIKYENIECYTTVMFPPDVEYDKMKSKYYYKYTDRSNNDQEIVQRYANKAMNVRSKMLRDLLTDVEYEIYMDQTYYNRIKEFIDDIDNSLSYNIDPEGRDKPRYYSNFGSLPKEYVLGIIIRTKDYHNFGLYKMNVNNKTLQLIKLLHNDMIVLDENTQIMELYNDSNFLSYAVDFTNSYNTEFGDYVDNYDGDYIPIINSEGIEKIELCTSREYISKYFFNSTLDIYLDDVKHILTEVEFNEFLKVW